MATEYVHRVFLNIEGTELEAEESSYRASKEQEAVATMNRQNRAKGFIRGIPSFELTLTIPLNQDGHAVDLDRLFLDDTLFDVKMTYEGGAVRQFKDCSISDLDNASRVNESTKTTLTAQALDMFVG